MEKRKERGGERGGEREERGGRERWEGTQMGVPQNRLVN